MCSRDNGIIVFFCACVREYAHLTDDAAAAAVNIIEIIDAGAASRPADGRRSVPVHSNNNNNNCVSSIHNLVKVRPVTRQFALVTYLSWQLCYLLLPLPLSLLLLLTSLLLLLLWAHGR